MTKTNKIIYWIATLWMGLGMTSTGIVQLFHLKANVDYITHLGFPNYFLEMLGLCKILGTIIALVPKFPLLKEWAYAGFFFIMIGALYSHIAFGDPVKDMFPAMLLLVLTAVSWYFRPTSRRPILVHS